MRSLSEQIDSFFKPVVIKESPLDSITNELTSMRISDIPPVQEISSESKSPTSIRRIHKYTKWLEEREREDVEIIKNRKIEEIDLSWIGRSTRQHLRQNDLKRKRSDTIHEDKREKFLPKSRMNEV